MPTKHIVLKNQKLMKSVTCKSHELSHDGQICSVVRTGRITSVGVRLLLYNRLPNPSMFTLREFSL